MLCGMASIRKTSKGWQAIIRKKGHKTISKVFTKKKPAELWARGIEDELSESHCNSVAQSMLVSSLLKEYEDKFTHRKRSANREESRMRVLTEHFGDLMVADLSAEVVIGYVDDRLASVVSDTVRKEINTLSVAIDAGMALWGIKLAANPVTTAKGILKITKTLSPGVRRDRRPTSAEIKILRESKISDITMFAIETAMRRGEIANMMREHINGNVLLIPVTKTDKPRTIPLSPVAIKILKKLPAQINGAVWGVHPDTITNRFVDVCHENNIVDLRFHDLRHEATSRLVEKGLSTSQVASITGHTLQSLQRYTHLDPKKLAMKL